MVAGVESQARQMVRAAGHKYPAKDISREEFDALVADATGKPGSYTGLSSSIDSVLWGSLTAVKFAEGLGAGLFTGGLFLLGPSDVAIEKFPHGFAFFSGTVFIGDDGILSAIFKRSRISSTMVNPFGDERLLEFYRRLSVEVPGSYWYVPKEAGVTVPIVFHQGQGYPFVEGA
jgi:hypothetical protein